MEIEQLIADVHSANPKTGFTDRLKKVRAAVNVYGNVISMPFTDFADEHSDHTNHSDHDNNRPKPKTNDQLLKLKTITLKMVSEVNAHYDHSDHNDHSDAKP